MVHSRRISRRAEIINLLNEVNNEAILAIKHAETDVIYTRVKSMREWQQKIEKAMLMLCEKPAN